MYSNDGIMKKIKIKMAPARMEASVLNRFRIYMAIKPAREIHPPSPSFHQASIRAKREINQMMKMMVIIAPGILKGAPSELIMLPVKNTRVKQTRAVPIIRAIQRSMLREEFFGFIF